MRPDVSDSLYSIYQKYCPQCMTASAAGVERCACGYRFGETTSESRWQQVLEEERLYEDYLTARAAQAAQAAADARAAHTVDPEDPRKKAIALKALDEAEAARAELAAQSARRAEMAKHQGSAPRVVPSTAVFRSVAQALVKTESASTSKTASPAAMSCTPNDNNASVSAKSVVEAAQALQAELAQMRQADRPRAKRSAAKTPRPAGPPAQAKPIKAPSPAAASSAPKAETKPAPRATVPQASDKVATTKRVANPAPTPVKPVQVRAPVSLGSQECPTCTAILPYGTQACRCGYTWESIALTDVAAPVPPVAPASVSKPAATPAVRARLAREAEAVARKIEAKKTKECPHCTATVPMAVARCKCGFVFPSMDRGGLMPSLSIDPSELQELSKRR